MNRRLVVLLLLVCAGCLGPKHKEGGKRAAAATNQYTGSDLALAEPVAQTIAVPVKPADDTILSMPNKPPNTLTPMDQGHSAPDRRITQQLRRAIVSGQGGRHFSFAAKNIKIITINAEVTLRGVVQDDAEKEAIQLAAEQLAGVQKVNNELTVKHGPAS